MGRKEPTEAQRQQARERRERFRGIVRELGKMSDAERAELASRLPGLATCEGPTELEMVEVKARQGNLF